MTFTISPEGLALIMEHEGFRAEPKQLPDGAWVVGYGHVREAAGDAVSKAEAADLLARDLAPVEELVNARVTGELTQRQFDALVSFAFSVGPRTFESSQVLRRVNAGDLIAAACLMEAWRKSDVTGELEVAPALVRRRSVEKAMFLCDLACESAPSAFLRPKIDHAAAVLGAPIKYAPTPDLGAVVANSPRPPTAARLSEILKSEPATEVLLLTQVVTDDRSDHDIEITTAHAKPVARRNAPARAIAEHAAALRQVMTPWVRKALAVPAHAAAWISNLRNFRKA